VLVFSFSLPSACASACSKLNGITAAAARLPPAGDDCFALIVIGVDFCLLGAHCGESVDDMVQEVDYTTRHGSALPLLRRSGNLRR
jgi:hypothetical protein